MSEATDSSTRTEPVYVRLLDEGVDVYRPTRGVMLQHDVARLLATDDYDPEDENWEFKPGAAVRLEKRVLGGREVLVAIALAD